MELVQEQLDWLVDHCTTPGKVRVKIPPLEQSLVNLKLVQVEPFSEFLIPFNDGGDVFVLSVTYKGWAAIAMNRPDVIRDKELREMFDSRGAGHVIAEFSLEELPAMLSSGNRLLREAAVEKFEKLIDEEA